MVKTVAIAFRTMPICDGFYHYMSNKPQLRVKHCRYVSSSPGEEEEAASVGVAVVGRMLAEHGLRPLRAVELREECVGIGE